LAGRFNTLLASAANDEQAVQSLQAADMQVAYVETCRVPPLRGSGIRRRGDCAVRLIDNVRCPLQDLATELQGASFMILVLDVGNSQIFCGVFAKKNW